MSKKITYTCNICNEIKQPNELLCYYYGWKKQDKKKSYFFVDNLDGSDKHFCSDCLSSIKNLNFDDFERLSNTF